MSLIFNDTYMSLLQTKIALNDTRIIVKCVLQLEYHKTNN